MSSFYLKREKSVREKHIVSFSSTEKCEMFRSKITFKISSHWSKLLATSVSFCDYNKNYKQLQKLS